jgi:hypothetical protein
MAIESTRELGERNPILRRIQAMKHTKQTGGHTELITDEQTFNGATYRNGTYALPTYDDSYGPLWIHRDSIGISGIVRARTWEDAYSICEDEFFPEADETIEEIVKEYGFKREHRKVVKDASVLTASEYCAVGERFERQDDYPDGKLQPEFVRWQTVETPDPDACFENELFQEAFGFRNNGPNKHDKLNHGIYAKDLNGDSLDRLTAEMVAELGIVLDISGEKEDLDTQYANDPSNGGQF